MNLNDNCLNENKPAFSNPFNAKRVKNKIDDSYLIQFLNKKKSWVVTPKVYNILPAVRNLKRLIGHKSCIYDTLCLLEIYWSTCEVYVLELNLKPDGVLVFYYFCYACVISYWCEFLSTTKIWDSQALSFFKVSDSIDLLS